MQLQCGRWEQVPRPICVISPPQTGHVPVPSTFVLDNNVRRESYPKSHIPIGTVLGQKPLRRVCTMKREYALNFTPHLSQKASIWPFVRTALACGESVRPVCSRDHYKNACEYERSDIP